MAGDLNSVNVIGNLTRDPVLKVTDGGVPVCNFTIANNTSYYKNNEKIKEVSFFNCVAWRKTAEIVAENCKMGNKISISGELKQTSWKDKDTGDNRTKVEINALKIGFLFDRPEQKDDNEIPM